MLGLLTGSGVGIDLNELDAEVALAAERSTVTRRSVAYVAVFTW
jgi:hypothetical protein